MSDQPTQPYRKRLRYSVDGVPQFHTDGSELYEYVPAEPCEHGNYARHVIGASVATWHAVDLERGAEHAVDLEWCEGEPA